MTALQEVKEPRESGRITFLWLLLRCWESMTAILQVLAPLALSIVMALALAHALGFPGELRLSRQDYETVQKIYYPGFTCGGASEVTAVLLLLVLLLLPARADGAAFSLILAGLLALVIMHGVYWLFIHPINSFWLKDFELKGFAGCFFGVGARKESGELPDWTELRARWEYAHIARSALGMLALVFLAAAL